MKSFFLAVCITATCFPILADEWKSIRGNSGEGNWTGKTLLSQSEDVALRVRWKKQIGSGYSSVVVSDNKVLTMYTDGERDLVGCFDAKNGDTIWTFDMEPMFAGANGSFDGPLATPVVIDGTVYCLSARGNLFALNLQDGSEVWKRDLGKEEESALPMYGFSTTPVMVGDILCVLAGSEKGAMLGLDKQTGKTKWYAGSGRVSSQIPMLMEIEGKPTVVAGVGTNVMGVDPTSGEVLFQFEHGGSNGSAMMPVPLAENQFLLTNDDAFSKSFEIEADGSALLSKEAWKERSIKNTYNVPVMMGGNIYAYSTRILTCVDPQTGKAKWKSRNPGDGFIVGVDGHLILSTKDGTMHVAKASENGYEEVASSRVFEKLVWAIPAYADNAVFQRSFNEIACVEFVSQGSEQLASTMTGGEVAEGFAETLSQVSQATTAEQKQAIVAEFLDAQKTFPILEGNIAHFVYQGEAKDVALACDAFGARQEKPMLRVEGTDLFYYAMELPADQRLSYIFLKDYHPIQDSRNPRTMVSSMYAGEMEFAMRLPGEGPLKMSWFGMPNWQAPDWMGGDVYEWSGKKVSKEIEINDKSKYKVEVYLPPSYESKPEKRFPVIYLPEGSTPLQLADLDAAFDQFFSANPKHEAIVVFVQPGPFNPMGPPNNLTGNIVEKVVPFIDKNFRTIDDRTSRAAYGFGFSSSMAMMLAATHSDKFGAFAGHSPLVFDDARKATVAAFQKMNEPTRAYLDWGRFDMHNPVENWDIRDMAQTMHDAISENKQVQLSGGMVNDSTDWPSWKLRLGDAVKAMFPAPSK